MGKIETGARGVKPRVDLRLYRGLDSPSPPFAEVVELVDALASGASGRKPVGVRVPPSALRTRRTIRLSVYPSIRLVSRQCRVHVHGPRIDPAAQAAHLREARRLQDLERLERTRAVVAVGHHLAVTVQLAQAVRQLA